ncbi:MAG: hypothetical protein P0Y53_07065 [Candidatus Pseudobacter hemicellulosilyticus]|uniref:Uncharacterized protein n=1 Tax=Candidatus Pseudobacter hemicellulosilyticus TaxID=3121375 RepID=A0AAJ5WS82_9BACT|nr:MAG: hypothetical protein P0Y53_07065 [Pseudobacter sp.]
MEKKEKFGEKNTSHETIFLCCDKKIKRRRRHVKNAKNSPKKDRKKEVLVAVILQK